MNRKRWFFVDWLIAGLIGSCVCGASSQVRGEMRTWKDVSGKYSREAEFVQIDGQGVQLKTSTGKLVVSPFEKLSTADQDYVFARSSVGQRGVDSRPTAQDRPADGKWALLVGVNEYQQFSKLTFCERDVQQLRERLVVLGFPDDHIIVLRDGGGHPERRPTKANIELWLDRLLAGRIEQHGEKNIRVARPRMVGKGDQVFVAFSGHGVQLAGVSYFCPGASNLADPAGTMVSMLRVYQQLGSASQGLRGRGKGSSHRFSTHRFS